MNETQESQTNRTNHQSSIYTDMPSAHALEKAPHMLITIHDQTPADRGQERKPRLVDALCVARPNLRKACRLFIVMLALLATVACEGTAGPSSAGSATSACPGSVSLAWSIISASGRPLLCSEAGATSVALRLQSRTGGTPVFTAFPCANSPAVANVAPGLYDVAIELHNAASARLGTAPPQTSVAIAVGRTKVLTPVTFAVANSRVALSLEAENTTSNCRPSSAGGAGITGTTITIVRAGGGCAAATLVRSRGGAQIGTYQVNCSSPEVASCIEPDEILTTTGLEPNAYVARVRGLVGAAECWAAESQLDVPAAGQLQTRIVLRRQSAPGC